MPGTRNRHEQLPSNARVRQAQHRERAAALGARRHKSPERQARLHPSRAEKQTVTIVGDPTGQTWTMSDGEATKTFSTFETITTAQEFKGQPVTTPTHPLPWRAPDKKRRPGGDWMILDANGDVAEYAKSRDKARARVREVNG